MKQMLMACLLTLPFFSQADTGSPDTTSHVFEEKLNWAGIKSKAAREGKYIFVDAFATWCLPCKVMDNSVYPNDSIRGLMQKKFVAVKIQMDKTDNDPANVKNWYKEADIFRATYKITAYPTILIFTPDGRVVFNEANAYSVKDLYKVMESATDPSTTHMYVAIEEYKNGKKEYEKLDSLALFVSKVVRNKAMADSIAEDYKAKYLDKLSTSELYQPRYFSFIAKFPAILNTRDKVFPLLLHHPESADSLFGTTNWAKGLALQLIMRDELKNPLVSLLKKDSAFKPDWEMLKTNISSKYPNIDADKLIADFQLNYYSMYAVNWKLWAIYKQQHLDKYPPDYSSVLDIIMQLNDGGAWYVFNQCNDTSVMRFAISWVDLAIKKRSLIDSPYNCFSFFDTKANLLGKIGDLDAAIYWEQIAVDNCQEWLAKTGATARSKKILTSFQNTLDEMKRRKSEAAQSKRTGG